MAIALAQNAAKRVYILGRRRDVLENVSKETVCQQLQTCTPKTLCVHAYQLQGLQNIVPLQCDVTNREDLRSAAAFVQRDIGYIDLLVANSGIPGPSGDTLSGSSIRQLQETLFNIPMEDFTNTYHVDCTAVFYTVLAFLHLLDEGNRQSQY